MKRVVMLGSGREVHGGVSAMVEVCFGHGLFERWEAEYIATHCNGGAARKALVAMRAWIRFASRLLAGRVALAHVHIASGASFWRKLLLVAPARALGVPYVLHVHTGDLAGFHERSAPPVRALLRWLYGGARAVVALSPAWRRSIEAVVPGARIHVIPNPVAIPSWRGETGRPPRALFLGVVREEKGVYDLLAAWVGVRASLPQARLVIAGSGDLARARVRASELGVEDSVEFPGWVGGSEKAKLLAEATVLVLPSHAEVLPMAVLEGMAAGLPVVATQVGALPEVVGDAGLLVPPRDSEALARALVSALGDEPARIAMGAAGRLRARGEFSADVVVPAIERVWEDIAPTAKRTTPVAAALP